MALEAKYDEGSQGSRAMFDVKAPMLITGGTFNITTGGADNDNHRQKGKRWFWCELSGDPTKDALHSVQGFRTLRSSERYER